MRTPRVASVAARVRFHASVAPEIASRLSTSVIGSGFSVSRSSLRCVLAMSLVRKQMLASADTYFGIESGAFDSYLPDQETLASITIPIELLVSEQSHAFFAQAAGRLAGRLGVDVAHTPGTHFAYFDHPQELAQTVRPFLRGVSM